MRLPSYLECAFDFPTFHKLRLIYPRPRLADIETELAKGLHAQLDRIQLQAGQSVGVGVGSRGITDINKIVAITCSAIRHHGGDPIIIPAMGSHGGATAAGQLGVLNTLGITEESCGCGFAASMEATQIATAFSDVPVFYSREAAALDHVICINRIKPHTKFKAPLESGILKMLCIGLGKHEGALAYHKWALKYGFYPLLKEIAGHVIKASNFRFGIGLVENAYDEIMRVETVGAEDLFWREPELLQIAKDNLPRLPVDRADVLIIREIGKNISGAGMDPNITGRASDLMEDDFSAIFKATRLAILNLSAASKGNGLGIGNADIITEKVYTALDYPVTLMNVLTGMSLKKASIPIRMPTDEKAIQACFTTLGPIPAQEVTALIINNTLDITECWASSAVLPRLNANQNVEDMGQTPLAFTPKGDLVLA